jgi:glycerol-3-phosphate acyltransferase PlsY
MAINPMLAAATLLSFAIVLAFSRYVSLAAIVAAAPPRIETIEEARRKAEGFHDAP